ncbi:hypothetical protein ACFSLT_01135 [Novosphingobium resinovorum]
MLRFAVDPPGARVRDVYIGYRNLDDLSLMRKLSAMSPQSLLRLEGIWLALMGVFAGAIFSAFAYNLLIYTGQRLVFQRWYLVWSLLVLAYGLTWTNVLAFAFPEYVGPFAVTTDYLLVAGLIAAGNMFFLAVIEEGVLPRWLVRWGRSAPASTWWSAFSPPSSPSLRRSCWTAGSTWSSSSAPPASASA